MIQLQIIGDVRRMRNFWSRSRDFEPAYFMSDV
jgi:hypothetical protein